MKTRYWDGDTFERHGRTFKVELPYDDDRDAPWDREDGHGPVSDWRRVDSCTGRPTKAPGERVIYRDGRDYRTYDFAAALRMAAADGWGLSDEDRAKLAQRLGRDPTKREVQVQAVEQDYQRLQAWCCDEWGYVGVVVADTATGDRESLWGIESDCEDYIVEVAHEMADEIADRNDWTSEKRAERAEWAARDVVTL
jgi:hypothetical protein